MTRLTVAVLFLCFSLACGDDDGAPAVDAGGGDAAEPTDVGPDVPRPPPFEGPTGTTEGCGTAPEPGTFTMEVAGEERSYIVAVGAGYDPEVGAPLVFAFHGLGDSARNFSNLAFEGLTGGVTVYPQGTPLIMGADGWDLDGEGKDVAFFDALFEAMSASYCVDRARVFSTGFSYGGYFTHTLGCARGDVLRAVAPVSAGRGGATSCAGQAAILAVHGTEDSVVPYRLGRGAFGRWLGANGCDASTTEPDGERCERHVGCDAPYPTVWCEHGGAHTYPSWIRGTIWAFFDGLE